ncbi:putative LysR family regulatory protein [Trichoderma compactum]
MGLFSKKRAPPPTIPTDEVIPVRFVDELYQWSFDFTLFFEDVMDVEILRNSVDRLLQKDGWRQLGARLRRAKNGGLEYHLPTEFTEKRPLYLFTTEEHDMSIHDHPGLRNLPKPDGKRPTIFEPSAASFRQYARAPTTPEAFDDWLYNDIPQLSFHVVNFEDASIITVTALHTLTDMMGLGSFCHAWQAMLRGEEERIPPFIGYKDKDPLEGLQQGKKPPKYIFADRLLKGWGFFTFVIRNMFDRWWYPHASVRYISLPGKFVDKLTASARKELEAAQGDVDPSDTFISESDVLNAWWTRIIIKNLKPPTNRTVCITNNFDCRDILAKMGLLPSSNVALLGNAVYSAPCFILISKFANTTYPLGVLAHQVRNTIKIHRTVEQVQAQDAEYRESKRKTGHLPLYGDSDMLLCLVTNVYRGRLYQMDFSPAVVAQGDQEKKKKVGRPMFVNFTAMESRWATRNGSAILGKSNTGDWWMSSRLRHDVWKKVEKHFETL